MTLTDIRLKWLNILMQGVFLKVLNNNKIKHQASSHVITDKQVEIILHEIGRNV